MTKQTHADPGMIENFKIKVRNWWVSVGNLKKTPVPASKQAEKDKLLSRAETIRKTIKGLTSWSDTLKISELNQGLGFLPLIPVAIIGGAVASIGYWLNDYAKFSKSIAYQADLVSQGIPPAQAAIMANDQAQSGSIIGELSGIMKMVLIAGAGYFIYIKFVKKA